MNNEKHNIGSIENHRADRESGALVYPVYSRRSEGLSIGINLFPDKKICSFDCPYCEVFPFQTNIHFSIDVMKKELTQTIENAHEQNISIRDICFSGNGEPTMPPHFKQALNEAASIRDDLAPDAKLVVITNGTMLLHQSMFDYLIDAAVGSKHLDIWLKVDAGTEVWYNNINRSEVSFSHLIERIERFAEKAPFTIQTMICSVDNEEPSSEENSAWIMLISRLARIAEKSCGIKSIQIYGKARPAPEDPKAEKLPENILHDRANMLRSALEKAGMTIPVIKVYP